MPDLIGASLGPYRIVEQAGRGGMATVYKAYHPATDRYVAIKVLPSELADDPNFLTRFEREAKVVAGLQHVHILSVFDYGQERGITYLVMPYIPTGTLKDYLLDGPPPLTETVRLFSQIAEAVNYAHRKSIIHRDLKPGNVLLDDSKNALLSDFGLTRIAQSSSTLTGTGVIGTPAYMSPEQGQGRDVDERSDIYSLGIILYEMVVGHVPFSADTPVAVIFKHISEPLPLPRSIAPTVPESVQNVILKGLAKHPDDRYASAKAMAEALQQAIVLATAPTEPAIVQPASADETAGAPFTGAPATTAVAYDSPETVIGTTRPAAAGPAPADTAAYTPPNARRWLPLALVGVIAAVLVILAALALSSGGPGSATSAVTATSAPTEPPASPTPIPATATRVPSSPTAIPPTDTEVPPSPPAVAQVPEVINISEAMPDHALEIAMCNPENPALGFCLTTLPDGSTSSFVRDDDLVITGNASWSPDGTRFVFSARLPDQPDDSYQIYIAGVEDRVPTQLPWLRGHGNDLSPAWSPDGEWLVFHHNGSIARMHPDGSGQQVIFEDQETCSFEPQWSPDGQHVVIVMQMSGCQRAFPQNMAIWVMTPDGETITPIVELSSVNVECYLPEVAFSPDSTQVAYLDETCRPMLINADGSGEPVPMDVFPYWWLARVYPSWGSEPLSEDILAAAQAEPETAEAVSPGHLINGCEDGPGLCILDDAGHVVSRIELSEPLTHISTPAWSPDGQQMVFAATGSRRSSHWLYVVDVSSGEVQLISIRGNSTMPAWSPDGAWIALHSSGDLLLVRPDGTEHLNFNINCAHFPQWSPDSQRIVVSITHDGCAEHLPFTREVRVLDRSGEVLATVATTTHEDSACCDLSVAFSPDGRHVAYIDEHCQPRLAPADGSGESQPLDAFPTWWTGAYHPQWQGEITPPPAAALPANLTFTVPGNASWIETGVELREGQRYRLRVEGEINIWNTCEEQKAAAGIPDFDCAEAINGPRGGPDLLALLGIEESPYPIPDARVGALLGRIGEGAPFTVRNGGTFQAEMDGPLFLGINDDVFDDNDGAFIVTIELLDGQESAPAPDEPGTSATVAEVAVPANADWVETPIILREGQRYRLRVEGEINIWNTCEEQKAEFGIPDFDCAEAIVGPRGGPDLVEIMGLPEASYPSPAARVGALLGRIGEGAPFTVRNGGTFQAETDGPLFLGINDDFFDDNDGAFLVFIEVRGGA